MRKIVHVDMDCFYAAVECREQPHLKQLPVGVGGSDGRGVLTTCNYPARRFGCRSAMPVFKARELCPDIVLLPVRFELYREESRAVRKIFLDYTDRIEPLSLDEAYLDVSASDRFASEIAKEIRQRIETERELTASAGIAPNKMLAKIASDWRKPNGQFVIRPEKIEAFMEALPVRKIPGIGKRAEEKLSKAGISTCGDLQKLNQVELGKLFGPSWAQELYERCRGQDDREVEVNRVRKSFSTERTFERDLPDLEACLSAMDPMLEQLAVELSESKNNKPFNKIFVKVKFANFQSTTKEAAGTAIESNHFSKLLAEAFSRSPHAVRLIGVGVRYREDDESQLQLDF